MKINLTDRQAEALASWIAYLDAGPTDWEESSPADANLVRRVGDKLAGERLMHRKLKTANALQAASLKATKAD